MSGCDDTEVTPQGVFELNIQPVVGGQEFESSTAYENTDGRKYQVDEFKLLLSDIILVKESGEEIVLSEVSLIDFIQGSFNKVHTWFWRLQNL